MEREDQNASLRSPLIQISGQHGVTVDNHIEQNKKRVIERREVFEEVKKQLWLAGPLISVGLLNFCIQIISVMFVGHLGELALSGASMATSFCSVTGISLLLGMASALDTLCGQSYGAKQHRMLGIHMQRAMLVLMIVSIPLAIIWANTRSILIFLGQDPEISAVAGTYAQLMVPCLFAYGLLQCINRFLQTQNIVFPMMFSSAVTTLLHLLICWVMVFKSGLGNKGAAIANSISYWVNVLILTLYVMFSPSCAKTWTGFSKEALLNIPSFMKLAIPSAVMVCLEMWSFEMMVLLSGLLPNPKLETSVLSICLNTASTVWMIPFGLSGAVSIRVSNELGAGHPWTARLAVWIVLVMAIIEGTLVGIVMILIRNIWGYAYSNELEVVEYVAIMTPILAASNFLDGLQCVLSGTARGCGWQKIGAYINLGSYYLVGIPSAIILAFVLHVGGKGLWLGIICALVVQVLSLLIITLRTNWEQEAKKATDRVHDSITPDNIIS
ncbi:protein DETOXIFICATION 16-like [Gastrolobium bilobum]|uniref:protein DETOXIFICATION 16-like n=1 Tax=Gastrolobium bilobum TaxID=150636 RepID=UPI002AB04332|nr:protein DETOXIFICATION 16-like [Gastrolobium bilobum]